MRRDAGRHDRLGVGQLAGMGPCSLVRIADDLGAQIMRRPARLCRVGLSISGYSRDKTGSIQGRQGIICRLLDIPPFQRWGRFVA